MKKILSIFITVLVLLSCLSLTAAADTMIVPGDDDAITIQDPLATIAFSDDYKTIACGKYTYSRFVINDLDFDIYFTVENELVLSDAQEKEIDTVDLTTDENGAIICADIYFKDGANLYVYYLREDYIDEYNSLNYADAEKLYVYFGVRSSGDDIITEATKESLKGEKTTINVSLLLLDDWFDVSIKAENLDLSKRVGLLVILEGEYYYIDFNDFKIDNSDFDVMSYSGDAYKITDIALIQKLEEDHNLYYEEDYGFFFNDNFTKTVSNIFIILVFAIIPFAILVLTLILGIKAKGIYKKLYFTTCILAAAELITLGIVLLIG